MGRIEVRPTAEPTNFNCSIQDAIEDIPYSKTKCTTVSLFNRRWCMDKCYRHFDHKERTLMYWWRKENLSLREIARRLRRSHTSISRELRRNRWCGQSYFPRGAQILAVSRVQRRAKRDRLKSKQVQAQWFGRRGPRISRTTLVGSCVARREKNRRWSPPSPWNSTTRWTPTWPMPVF